MALESTTTIKRRNTVPPTSVLIPHRKLKTAPFDYELVVSLKSDSYTSLKDILPSTPASSILSPTPAIALAGVSSSSSGSGYEISIRNRLVKQAAWAYLQPALLLSSPSSSSRHLCFFSADHLRQLFAQVRRALSETLTRVYDCLVDALWLFLCR
ncbi:Asparagine--tRNA ligase [Bienertia sinuspersici]